MMKYLKWFLLFLLIISSVILGIKIVNYNRNNDNNEYDKNNQLYNSWTLTKLEYYENNQLVNNESILESSYYMIFDFDVVRYCDMDNIQCVEYTYSYNDNQIIINSEDYFIRKDTYNIDLNNNELVLSKVDETRKTIYYLTGGSG